MFSKFRGKKLRDVGNVLENDDDRIYSVVLGTMVMVGICKMLE
jgi:hypothetical protein